MTSRRKFLTCVLRGSSHVIRHTMYKKFQSFFENSKSCIVNIESLLYSRIVQARRQEFPEGGSAGGLGAV